MKRHPFLSVAAIGAGGIWVASVLGVAEVAFGSAVAYAAYKVLRENEPPLEAVAELEEQMRP